MNGYLTFLIFLIYIIYNIISISILDINDSGWIYSLIGIIAGFVSLIILVIYYVWWKKYINLGILILLGLILVIGYIFSILNINKNIEKKDENILNASRMKTIISSILFIAIISWLKKKLLPEEKDI